jgi:hypothetical protein
VAPVMQVVRDTAPMLWTRLPGGWQVGGWTGTDGRTRIDVTDPLGELVYRAGSTWRSAVSVNAGWAGHTVGADGERQSWALAIGHAPSGIGHVVSFAGVVPGTGLQRMTLPPEAPTAFWLIHDGLWAAAAVGCYTHVRLTARATLIVHPLDIVADDGRSG